LSQPGDHRPYAGRSTALAIAPRNALALETQAAGSTSDQLDQAVHLRDLLRIFLKRKWTILSIFAVSALFSVVMTYLAPPVYRASTTVQIDRFSPRVLDFKDVSPGESSDYWSDGSDFYATTTSC
jgi:polysaccharide biosynthesis transport protein